MEAAPVDAARLARRLRRESAARAEAEAIAERTLSELYEAVQDLACSRAVLDATTDFVAILDADGVPIYLNPALCELLGVEPAPPYDVDVLAHLTPQSHERFLAEALPALDAKDLWHGEFAVRRPSGADVPLSQVLIAHRNRAGKLLRISAIARDVSEQRELTDLLAHRATHDALTGLPNRRLLYDRLDLALARSVRGGTPLALLFLDLDGFKRINDTLGHAGGDALLVATVDRLVARMRTVDTLARVGGDEFVLLCEVVGSATDAAEIAQRLLDAVAEPLIIGTESVTVSVSIGVAVSDGGAVDPEALVRLADDAMYAAKRAGKGRYELVFPPNA